MEQLKPPNGLCLEGNLSVNWKKFLQRYELYALATGANEKNAEVQSSLFLHIIGKEALAIYNTFKFEPQGDEKKLQCIKAKFEAYCNPKKNLTVERHVFFTRAQNEGESIDTYVTDLKNKSKTCEFGNLEESLITDRIVCGIRSTGLRERLLRETDLTLSKALTICRAAELSKTGVKDLQKNKQPIPSNSRPTETSTSERTQKGSKKFSCKKCSYEHEPRCCPAYGKLCKRCGKPNHFAKMCRTPHKTKTVQEIKDENSSDDTEEDFFIDVVHMINDGFKADGNHEWKVHLKLKGMKLPFKIDTGADANIISKSVYQKCAKDVSLYKTSIKLKTYSGEKITVLGRCKLRCILKGKAYGLNFLVVDMESQNILGLKDSVDLGLIQRVQVVSEEIGSDKGMNELLQRYKEVFSGVGCTDKQHHIELKSDHTPCVHPPRKVPHAMKERLKTELTRMEKENIIAKVDYPTDWVNSMVVKEKPNGRLRICLDPSDLNKAVKREHYHLPTVEEITSTLKGAKHFSVLDANSGFWQIPLDKESSDLCCFNKPFGRYKFLRLPFGLHSSSEVFHRTMCELMEGMEGCHIYLDDILVWGKSKEEHNVRLEMVLKRAKENNLKFNKSKCKIGVTEVKYLGQVLNEEGVKPDVSKIEAIEKMKSPTCKKELQRFIGMIQYLSKFIPSLSAEAAPLRQLLKQNSDWVWDENNEKVFKKLKNMAIQAPVLKYFDPNKPITLSVDASQYGLGAVLLQDNMPVAFASRALTKAQEGYAQIEKETLAICFGCERFHQYIYGQPVTVHSDHKPLEIITKKPLAKAPPRVQRLLLKLMKYDLHVVHTPGKYMYIADTLSRSYLPHEGNDKLDEELEAQVHCLMTNLPVSERRRQQFVECTNTDQTLKILRKVVEKGWPEDKTEVPDEIREYWDFRDEITQLVTCCLKVHK
ncbi:hypothetical protein HOLleu_28054 [Holothuria leucospilota]|uniref:Reverse transcriptase n=1 Tax=Holothuria leucospilota TaxID=206669 RepID=A0A9Q1H2S6_HOLLE|nr:hypothetical protein HOLleu_28054 [Holothuria leucospilota]